MPVDYTQSKVYRLACDEDPSLCYFGSTSGPLSKRLFQHKASYKAWIGGKGKYMTSFEICKHPSALIVLVEEVCASSKVELHARERWHIENNPCVNKLVPGRTRPEHYVANCTVLKAKSVEYRAANRDVLKAKAVSKIICQCGSTVSRTNKAVHERTKKHQARVAGTLSA